MTVSEEVQRPWLPPGLRAHGLSQDDVRELTYVVVDEIVGSSVTMTLSEWPWADARGRLRFTVDDRTRGVTVDLHALDRALYRGWLRRSPRVGDVFAAHVPDPAHEAQEPFEAEYRLARWNRAWLVLNNNGHVHSSRACGTCFATTQFGWLPQLSGADEAYIVEQAGEAACTVCYPSAPVASLNQPRRVFHKTEEEAQRAREERAAAKAEREAKKIAKAITTPEGEPLEVFDWRSPERREQQRDGSIKVVPAKDRFKVLPTLAQAKTWLTDSQETYYPKPAEDVQRVAEAIAFKTGTTAQAEIDAAKKRAAKRR